VHGSVGEFEIVQHFGRPDFCLDCNGKAVRGEAACRQRCDGQTKDWSSESWPRRYGKI